MTDSVQKIPSLKMLAHGKDFQITAALMLNACETDLTISVLNDPPSV